MNKSNNTVIIKYNAGNVQSVLFALERIGINATVTDNHEAILAADKVIFPGVGNAGSAMKSLQNSNLDALIKSLKQPVLGICVGMQLLCRFSEESSTTCLGIIDETVQLFKPPTDQSQTFKVPQMGWNQIYDLKSPLFQSLNQHEYCYFVHSYFVPLNPYTIATANYIQPYSAAIQKDNFYGVQFHTEKSATYGELILKNFMNL